MTFFSILEAVFIGPLKLIFEIIFEFANRFVNHPGFSIIFLSLVMNILVLPLYKRADAMQEAARDIEAKLSRGVTHIKKTFSGDERMMIMQTYYRQNNYKPTSALGGSVSLLLEIPFFMAAYQFLSHLEILNGVSLGPIADLGAPDGILTIGSLTINVLPFLMTLVNVISSAIYLKGFPLKTKVQLYAMALFFLVFLYTSPSGLVFYWTLNNVFSLVKTIFYKIKNPKKVLNILTFIIGLAALVFGIFFYRTESLQLKAILIGIGALLVLPLILSLLSGKIRLPKLKAPPVHSRKIFIAGGLLLTVVVGILIPSAYISASPQEYIDITYFHNPLWYIVNAACLAAGFFVVWFNVFYWLASEKGKAIFDKVIWILCGVAMVNYLFFGTNLGIISSTLQYENKMSFSAVELLINLAVLLAVAALMYFIITKFKRIVSLVLATAILATAGMSAVNIVDINKSVSILNSSETAQSNGIFNIQLSKSGKNVVVLMLDRAISSYVPYLLNERPELKNQFAGFTYYPNTISFGGFTNFGTPALLGGYDYTPVEMNKRSDKTLAQKQNEALKVLPSVFSNNGYQVTVCDPVYANYQWIPDISVFDGMQNVNAYITKGKFSDNSAKQTVINNNRRNFFCFSLMKSMPLALQPTLYNNGRYNAITTNDILEPALTQTRTSLSTATGIHPSFTDAYNVLTSLSSITKISNTAQNTYLFMVNDATHEPMMLKEPEYEPTPVVDNTEYDRTHTDRFKLNGSEIKVENETQMIHYQANMAVFIQLGKWFDFLRENGVYDNTRIILVSDHGQPLGQVENLVVEQGNKQKDAMFYNALLMVKDFGSTTFTTSNEFMTNADVPTLSTNGLIQSPVNPYTGNAITGNEKTAHDQYVIVSNDWDIKNNQGNTFLPAKWASVKDDIHNKNNWTFYDKETVLTDYAAP